MGAVVNQGSVGCWLRPGAVHGRTVPMMLNWYELGNEEAGRCSSEEETHRNQVPTNPLKIFLRSVYSSNLE